MIEKCVSDEWELVVWLDSIWVSYEKPSSPYCVVYYFLVRLQGKFEIDRELLWRVSVATCDHALVLFVKEEISLFAQ